MSSLPHQQRHSAAEAAPDQIAVSRAAQARWRKIPVRARLAVLRRLRHQVAEDPQHIVDAIRSCRTGSTNAEILASEVLPFLDAIRFLERNAERLLETKRPDNANRPFWLAGVELEIQREPHGTVLIIAPSNYPLFLPGVQIVQALAAGNAVLVKPGPGGEAAMFALQEHAIRAGLDPDLLTVLDEDPSSATNAICAGVDKIWLTGSAATGRDVARLASETLTPLVCELSGCDAVVVLPGADLDLATRAIRFGLGLNNAQTCMRPHRVLVHASIAQEFTRHLVHCMSGLKVTVPPRTVPKLRGLINGALLQGATQLHGEINGNEITPVIVADVPTDSLLWNADIFAPVLVIHTYDSPTEAVRLHNACDYGLTAAIFGPEREAREIARLLDAGTVLINDLIVPTADPRLPFSGRKQSGYGATRGAEGLLEFTQVKSVTVRRRSYQHLDPLHEDDAELFTGSIAAAHGGSLTARLLGALRAAKAAYRRYRSLSRSNHHA